MRLGGNFSMMLMVQTEGNGETQQKLLKPDVVDSLGLHLHVDAIKGQLHHHRQPDVSITVYGTDRAGIVARVTGILAEAGLHILGLESDVAGSRKNPIYIMHIEGHADKGIEALRSALETIKHDDIEVTLKPVEMMVG